MGLWSVSQNILSSKALLMNVKYNLLILAFIHSINISSLIASHMPGTRLSIGNKVQANAFPHGAYFFSELTAFLLLSVV